VGRRAPFGHDGVRYRPAVISRAAE
jgi:hypothetical protein